MTRNEFLLQVTKGNQSAAAFLAMVSDIAHTWDDLIDKDHEVTDFAINRAFTLALTGLPNNAFYSANFSQLNPLLISSINNWIVANELEKMDTEESKRIAFITRSAYTDLITHVAFLIGGSEWLEEIGPKIRLFVHAEGWDVYQENLVNERSARMRLRGE